MTYKKNKSPSFTDLLDARNDILKIDSSIDMRKIEQILFVKPTSRTYYLYGQKRINRETQLTPPIFIETIRLHNKRIRQCGTSCNSFEMENFTRHETTFKNIQKAVTIWKSILNN